MSDRLEGVTLRWFEVESRFRHDPRIKRIRQRFGKEGLATTVLLWGEIADQGARPGVGVDRGGHPLHVKDLAEACGLTVRKFEEFVGYCAGIGHVDRAKWERDGVILLPAMVRRGRKIGEVKDETSRKAEQRERHFSRIAALQGGKFCAHCRGLEQLELERKDPAGGNADANVQIACVPCARRRRAERLMRPAESLAPAGGPGENPPNTRDATEPHPPSTRGAPAGTVLAVSESPAKTAECPAERPQDVPQDAGTGTCTGGVITNSSTAHTPSRARAFNASLPLIGQVPVRPRGLNPALAAPVAHGSLPREHLNCFSAPLCGRVCFPLSLATQLARQLGGEPDHALEQLEAFRVEVLAGIPEDQAIGDKPFDFWRAHFAAKFPSAAPKGAAAGSLTKPNAAAGRTGAPAADKYDRITRRAQ